MARRSAALAAFTLALAGCGGNIPLDVYPGDPILTVAGDLQWTSGQMPPLQMALQWQEGDAPAFQPAVTGAREVPNAPPVDSTLTFTGFSLRVFYPPPDVALVPWFDPNVRIARGNVAAVPYGYPDAWIDDAVTTQSSFYGADVYHWVVFSYDRIPARSVTAWWTGTLGVGLEPGFHLFDVTPFNPTCLTPAALDACAATLVSLGVTDDGTSAAGTARGLCTAPYRLTPVTLDPVSLVTGLVVPLGTWGLPDPGACP